MASLIKNLNIQYLKPLFDFRNWVLKTTNVRDNPDSRIEREGSPRGLTVKTRRIIFEKLMKIQNETRLNLISDEERMAIIRQWNKE